MLRKCFLKTKYKSHLCSIISRKVYQTVVFFLFFFCCCFSKSGERGGYLSRWLPLLYISLHVNSHRGIPLYYIFIFVIIVSFNLPTILFSLIALPGGQTLNQLITFTPSDSEKSITFNIPDDNIALEPPETFTLTLTAVTIIDGIMLQPNDKTDITILDDDGKCPHHENKYFT